MLRLDDIQWQGIVLRPSPNGFEVLVMGHYWRTARGRVRVFKTHTGAERAIEKALLSGAK